ncbi:hypothetical protein OAD67_00745 [bacterium]|jgi:hypothetical protein|nr:hypothetical protein [bacterium]|tara:strand:+ start:1052 stop:1285 length:234 start_codon:yes stop_codon:yes gene_type:complete
MSSNVMLGVETRSSKRKRERRDAHTGEAFPGLPNHLVVAHILRSAYFDDPADLATRWRRQGWSLRSLVNEAPWSLDV